MFWDIRREIRRQLEFELRRESGRQRLRILAEEFPSFQRFPTWEELFQHLLSRSVSNQEKDDLLRSLVWSTQHETCTTLSSVLLLAFWPGLFSVAERCQAWDDDPDELWSQVQWAFLETVYALDILANPHGIAPRVCHAVYDCLRTQYRADWSHRRREIPESRMPPDDLVGDVPDETIIADPDRRALAALAPRRLATALRRGLIRRDEFDLLTAVDQDGTPLEEYAEGAGINYETAKKRHQRALDKVRSLFREKCSTRKKSCPRIPRKLPFSE